MPRNIVALGAAALAFTQAAAAAELYGVAAYAPFTSQWLYTIDTGTGFATPVGDTGIEKINGIEWDDATGRLFAYTTDAELYTLDLNTAAATLVADQPLTMPEGGLAFNSYGQLFANSNSQVGLVDTTTGQFSPYVPMTAPANDISGLAFDEQNRLLGYSKNGALEDTLVSIDLVTGEIAEVGPTGILSTSGVGGLDFDPDSGLLYLSDHARLYLVNPADGAAALVGEHGVSGMSGIAFIPEPAAFALLLGLVPLLRRRIM